MEAIPHKGTNTKERLYVLYTVNAINRFPSLVNQKRHLVSAPPPPRAKKDLPKDNPNEQNKHFCKVETNVFVHEVCTEGKVSFRNSLTLSESASM